MLSIDVIWQVKNICIHRDLNMETAKQKTAKFGGKHKYDLLSCVVQGAVHFVQHYFIFLLQLQLGPIEIRMEFSITYSLTTSENPLSFNKLIITTLYSLQRLATLSALTCRDSPYCILYQDCYFRKARDALSIHRKFY